MSGLLKGWCKLLKVTKTGEEWYRWRVEGRNADGQEICWSVPDLNWCGWDRTDPKTLELLKENGAA